MLRIPDKTHTKKPIKHLGKSSQTLLDRNRVLIHLGINDSLGDWLFISETLTGRLAEIQEQVDVIMSMRVYWDSLASRLFFRVQPVF